MSDVRLDDPQELAVKIIANDVDLISPRPERRANNDNPRRRALVHGYEDQLVLNYDDDFAGGVRIISSPSVLIEANDLELRARNRERWGTNRKATRRALAHGAGDQLIINFDTDYSGGVHVNGDAHLRGAVYFRWSGVATVRQGQSSVAVPLWDKPQKVIDVRKTSVLATLQGDLPGVFVRGARATTTGVDVFLSVPAPENLRVAWFVMN